METGAIMMTEIIEIEIEAIVTDVVMLVIAMMATIITGIVIGTGTGGETAEIGTETGVILEIEIEVIVTDIEIVVGTIGRTHEMATEKEDETEITAGKEVVRGENSLPVGLTEIETATEVEIEEGTKTRKEGVQEVVVTEETVVQKKIGQNTGERKEVAVNEAGAKAAVLKG